MRCSCDRSVAPQQILQHGFLGPTPVRRCTWVAGSAGQMDPFLGRQFQLKTLQDLFRGGWVATSHARPCRITFGRILATGSVTNVGHDFAFVIVAFCGRGWDIVAVVVDVVVFFDL